MRTWLRGPRPSYVLVLLQAFCTSSSREIGAEDIMLAVQSQETFQFAQPPPQEASPALAGRAVIFSQRMSRGPLSRLARGMRGRHA